MVNLNKYNWDLIQKDFDSGLAYKYIYKKYKIGRRLFKRAISEKLFIISRNPQSHKHSEKTKTILRKKRIKFLNENPEQHNWSKYHKKSIPCDLLKKALNENNINYIEEYRPLENKFYKIDIAFPEIKFGIEVNGNQHYDLNTKKLKIYYQKRKDEIEAANWTILDLHYSLVFKRQVIENLIKNLRSNNVGRIKYLEKDWDISKKQKKKIQKDFDIIRKNKTNKEKINKLINSDINFNEYGWVKKAANIIECKHQHVKSWMTIWMKDFYKEQCFHKK